MSDEQDPRDGRTSGGVTYYQGVDMHEDTQPHSRVRFARNSPKCFLLGASWSHDKSWGRPRQTYVYLGPFLLTVKAKGTGALR